MKMPIHRRRMWIETINYCNKIEKEYYEKHKNDGVN